MSVEVGVNVAQREKLDGDFIPKGGPVPLLLLL